jgi:saccharopine dehydrogenase-like NADP-dependent oxidoreductase
MQEDFNKKNISAVFADIKDQACLNGVFEQADLVIASIPYKFNLDVMNACLKAKCHYIDLGGLFHVTREQLKLSSSYAQQNILAVLGMGAAPGTTNLMAKKGAQGLDRVEAIDIVIGCVDFGQLDHPFFPPYSLDTLLDEYTVEPMIFENGDFQARPPRSGYIELDMGAPVGKVGAIYTLHSEVATLPLTYQDKGIERVTFRLGLPSDFHNKLNFLAELGLGDREPLSVKTAQREHIAVLPRDVLSALIEKHPLVDSSIEDAEIIRVDVSGILSGKKVLRRLECVVGSNEQWQMSSGALDTGVPPSIVAHLILSGQLEKRGAYAPENCLDEDVFFKELSKRGMDINTLVLA